MQAYYPHGSWPSQKERFQCIETKEEMHNEKVISRMEKNLKFAEKHQQRQDSTNFSLPDMKCLNTFNFSCNPLEGLKKGDSIKKTNELYLQEKGWIDRRTSSSGTCGPYEFARGSRLGSRSQMEDEDGIEEITFKADDMEIKAPLFFVLDGHRGCGAAKFVKKHLATYLVKALESCNSEGLSETGIYEALKSFSIGLDLAFLESIKGSKTLKHTARDRSGTTATIVIEIGGFLYCANIGDSRTTIYLKEDKERNSYQAIQLSEDAVTKIKRYAKTIKKMGGKIIDNRVNGQITPARAFGNFEHFEDRPSEKLKGLSVVSKVTRFALKDIKKGSFLVLASDGLWDVLESEQLEDLFLKMKEDTLETMVRKLILGADEAGSKDNVSIVLVKF